MAVLLFMTAGRIHAARPFATDDAGTVARGTFELEAAEDYWHNAAAAGLCFKHGLTDRMDLGVTFGHCHLPDHECGASEAELGLKYALVPDLFSATFSGVFGDPAYGVNFIVSKPFGLFTLHGNLGGALTGASENAFLTYGIAGVFDISRFSAGVETGGSHEALDFWQVGVIFSITEWMALDAGLRGDFERDPAFMATTGLWFAFPNIQVQSE
jgi:hypothetical protein